MTRDTAPHGAPAADRIGAPNFAYLQGVLLRRTGTVLEAGKEYVVETRLHGLAVHEGFASVASLLEAVQTEPEAGALHRKVIEAMLNGETSFFRDLHPFVAIREVVLPELIERRRTSRCLNIWSAAAASGQEAYSIAMLLREHFPELASWRLRLIASDVSESALARARTGTFRQIEVNRGLPAALLLRYFERVGTEWRIRADLVRSLEFHMINLAGRWPSLPPMDLVLMRNVLLYFSADARRTALAQVAQVLQPDGCLFLGGGETSLAVDRAFVPVRMDKAVCYRLRGSAEAHHSKEVPGWKP